MTPYFSSSSPLLSVRKGSPARVFVWWWDRLSYSFFFFLFFSIFDSLSPLRSSHYVSCEQRCFSDCLLDFPTSSNVLVPRSTIIVTKTIEAPNKYHKHSLLSYYPPLICDRAKIRSFHLIHLSEAHFNHCKHQFTTISPFLLLHILCVLITLYLSELFFPFLS